MEYRNDEEESKEEGEEEIVSSNSFSQMIPNQTSNPGNVPSSNFLTQLLQTYSTQPQFQGVPLTNQYVVPNTISVPSLFQSSSIARFELRNQPNSRQERRPGQSKFILPNPLVIKLKDIPPTVQQFPNIREAFITAKLADREGNPLPDEKQKMLIPANNTSATQALSPSGTASFSLKMRGSEPGNTFRLAFFAKFLVEGSADFVEEKVVSRPFVMFSKKGYAGVLPIISGIMPRQGTPGTEVWIKGSGFKQGNAIVRFASVDAQVTESLPDLLTVTVPILHLVTAEIEVMVTVLNKHNTDEVPAEDELKFLYRPPNR